MLKHLDKHDVALEVLIGGPSGLVGLQSSFDLTQLHTAPHFVLQSQTHPLALAAAHHASLTGTSEARQLAKAP